MAYILQNDSSEAHELVLDLNYAQILDLNTSQTLDEGEQLTSEAESQEVANFNSSSDSNNREERVKSPPRKKKRTTKGDTLVNVLSEVKNALQESEETQIKMLEKQILAISALLQHR